MYHDQQIRILLSQGQSNQDPRTTFLDNLILQIWNWRTQKKAVLICLDANENVINPNLTQGIGRILTKMDLFDLHHHRHPQHPRLATYNQGNNTIDVCMGSPEFIASMTAAAILPFGIPVHLTGDHWALILDFDSRIVFGHKPPPSQYIYNQGVSSNAATVTQFSKIVGTQCDLYDIHSCITAIEDVDHLTPADEVTLNTIDRDLTTILTKADQQCHQFQDYPWSLTLHQAYIEHHYWTFQLSEFKMERSYAASYERLQPLLKDVDLNITPPATISSKQQQARQKLREIHRTAVTKRKEHLNTLIQAARATKNKARKQLILGMKQAEENCRCFSTVWQMLNLTTPGGLTQLIVPTLDTAAPWITINDKDTMEQHLLQHSQEHFSQAHGTPFTQPPLTDLLNFDGVTPFGDTILQAGPFHWTLQ